MKNGKAFPGSRQPLYIGVENGGAVQRENESNRKKLMKTCQTGIEPQPLSLSHIQ